jgi:hypothetical protein
MTTTRRPLYHRLLRLHHLRPGPTATFLLFEGSIMLAVVLSFAEVLAWWSVIVVPVAIGVMVKLNDVIAGVLRRPEAIAQLQRAPMVDGVAIGRSQGPSPAHLTTWISPDDAVADPRTRLESVPRPAATASHEVFRGIAAVPPRDEVRPAKDDMPLPRLDRGDQGRFAS